MQTLPGGGPYVKDDLISQINSNHERAEQLIGEIESMEGNAGAIVGAVVEVCLPQIESESPRLTSPRSFIVYVIRERQ